MRTIIDLPKTYLHQLDVLKKKENISRNELLKRLVKAYLDDQRQDQEAFGLWKKNKIDAVGHQESMRNEWKS